jgi:polyisoprenoid-binding protein YceI
MMRKISLIIVIAAFLLAACSSQPATQALSETPTMPAVPTEQMPDAPAETAEAAAPTQEPTATPPAAETSAPTMEPAVNAAPAAGLAVFNIIPGESQLQYEVGEVFINDNNRFAVAIGVSPQVTGEILIDRTAPQNSTIGTILADISQFKSDSGRRDNAIRGRYLESGRYPTATFVPTSIEGLPDSYQDGKEIPLVITGDLTIREVTRPVTFDAVVRLDGDQLSGQATTTILMSDFGFGPISIGGILNTEDEAKVTLTFVARP